jgi:hypothetical protein
LNLRRQFLFLLFGALVASLLAFGACSDDDDEDAGDGGDGEPSAEEIAEIEEIVAAILSADPTDPAQVDFWIEHMSDDVVQNFFGSTKEECAASPEDCIDDPTTENSFEGTTVTGDTAQTTAITEDGTFTFNLTAEGETWVVTEIRFGPAEVPEGVTGVNVQLNEYAFGFNASDIEDGNIAFPFENVGEEAHELVVLQTNEEFDVDAVIEAFSGQVEQEQSEEEASPAPGEEEEEGSPEDDLPPGIDNIYFGGIAGPGGRGIAVFEEPLAPGTYTMICVFPDPEGTTHAELGMVADFEVPE